MAHWRLPLILVGLLLPSAALACIWDYDTLLQERSRFPDALELITGKFLRHSQEFYYWRVSDRLKKLEEDPKNLSYHDDLAVAYDKIGDHRKAIEVTLAAALIMPARYETEANLGTFYIHAGQLEKGLEYIARALAINPHAHFGREKYQKFLVEYILACREDGKTTLPLAQSWAEIGNGRHGFPAFIAKKQGASDIGAVDRWPDPDRKEALKGILGIMRFGNHESPILLEVLAELLSRPMDMPEVDAKQLAARAYLKASYVAPDVTKKAYRDMAQRALSFQAGVNLEMVEVAFRKELDEAKVWSEQVRQDELTWLSNGKNPDEEFARKYYREPQISVNWIDYIREPGTVYALLGVGGTLAVGIVVLFVRRRSRKRIGQNQTPPSPKMA